MYPFLYIFSLSLSLSHTLKASTEWTWSGANTQISEIERIRSRASSKPRESLYKASFQQSKLRYDTGDVVDDFPKELPTKMNGTATNKSLFRRLNPFKKKLPDMLMKRHSVAVGVSDDLDSQAYIGRVLNGRASVSSLSKNYFAQARPSLFAVPHLEEKEEFLETTTVADLIRAIEMFHTDNVIAENSHETPPSTFTKQHEQKTVAMDRLPTPRRSALLTLLHRRHHSSHTIHGGPTAAATDNSIGSAFKRTRLYSCVEENLNDNSKRRILGDVNPFIKQRSPSLRPPPYSSPTSVTSGIRNDSINPAFKRRFSIRPANLDKAPGQFHKVQNFTPPTQTPTQHQHQQQQQALSTYQLQNKQSSSPSPLSKKS